MRGGTVRMRLIACIFLRRRIVMLCSMAMRVMIVMAMGIMKRMLDML